MNFFFPPKMNEHKLIRKISENQQILYYVCIIDICMSFIYLVLLFYRLCWRFLEQAHRLNSFVHSSKIAINFQFLFSKNNLKFSYLNTWSVFNIGTLSNKLSYILRFLNADFNRIRRKVCRSMAHKWPTVSASIVAALKNYKS